MSFLLYNQGEKALIDGFFGGLGSASASGSPVIIPSGSGTVGSFGVGLGTRSGGVGSSKSDALAQILEVGTSAANGYARQPIQRSQSAGVGWPAASLVAGSYQSAAPQVEFTFTGSPNPNGATLWFLAGNTTTSADNVLMGCDLTAAPHTYSNGEIQRCSPVFRIS